MAAGESFSTLRGHVLLFHDSKHEVEKLEGGRVDIFTRFHFGIEVTAGFREEAQLRVAANPLIKPVQSGLTGLLKGLVH